MSRVSLKVLLIVMLLFVWSCAPLLALHGSKDGEMVTRRGVAVTCVGNEPSAVRAIVWGGCDILTSFMCEFVGTPIELYMDSQAVCVPVDKRFFLNLIDWQPNNDTRNNK